MKMILPKIFWYSLMGIIAQRPLITFNKKLYLKLIKKCEVSSSEVSCDKEVEVTFTAGPIDNVLGSYDYESNVINIDALEIFLDILKKGEFKNIQDIESKYDDYLTEVVAHEGGHWHLYVKEGDKSWLDKIYLSVLFNWLGLSIIGGLGLSVLLGIKNLMQYLTSAFDPNSSIFLTIIFVVFVGYFVFEVCHALVQSWHVIRKSLVYKYCWHERFARQYENNPALNKEWDQVISVNMTD